MPHLNSKAELSETFGQRQLYPLGFSLHIGPASIYSSKVIDGRRQVVLLRANPRKLKAIVSDFVEGLLVQGVVLNRQRRLDGTNTIALAQLRRQPSPRAERTTAQPAHRSQRPAPACTGSRSKAVGNGSCTALIQRVCSGANCGCKGRLTVSVSTSRSLSKSKGNTHRLIPSP